MVQYVHMPNSDKKIIWHRSTWIFPLTFTTNVIFHSKETIFFYIFETKKRTFTFYSTWNYIFIFKELKYSYSHNTIHRTSADLALSSHVQIIRLKHSAEWKPVWERLLLLVTFMEICHLLLKKRSAWSRKPAN